MKHIWRKQWPKEHSGTKHQAGHVAKFRRPYRRQRRNWRDMLKELETQEVACG